MNRRKFLALGGLGIGMVGGYLGWRRYRTPSLPDGMTVETLHGVEDVLTEDSPRNSAFLDAEEEYHTIVESGDTADRELVESGYFAHFIADTDFEDSYLVVVQNGMQSVMELELDAISRRETGIHIDISIDSPSSGPDDLTIHSMLIRITDTQAEVPQTATVDIEGYI